MIDLDDLIAEARRWANGHPNRRVSELIHGLVDALEATTRDPVQGAPNDAVKAVIDRDVAIDAIAGGTISVPGGYGVLHGDDAANIVDAIIGHATVPDAATEDVQKMYDRACADIQEYSETIKRLQAERDAALEAIERVRAMVEEMGEAVGFDRLAHGQEAEYPVSYLRDKIEEALDGAPEPEALELPETGLEVRDGDGDLITTGEHRRVLHQGGYVCDTCVNILGINVRWDRADRMEGHPLPVEGESDGA